MSTSYGFYLKAGLVGLVLALAWLLWPNGQTPQAINSYASAVQNAAPAVVNIYTSKNVQRRRHPLLDDPFFQRFFPTPQQESQREQNSLGSGVIVHKAGYILTNHHVIRGADEIQVALRDGRIAQARLIGADPETDLAVLQISLKDLRVITLANMDTPQVGDIVLAIGNPFGVGQTVTQGIISALGRYGLGLNTFENFIQTDAAINPGNSGGALISQDGTLIGINTAIYSQSGGSHGIGFAIPIDIGLNVLTAIIEEGKVRRGWLGIDPQPLTPALAQQLGLSRQQTGIVIRALDPRGPAAQAGLRPGDVITAFDQQPIANNKMALDHIASKRPQDRVVIEFLRQGQPQRVTARLSERPSR